LQRTTRKLSLTDVGEAYHRHCVAMRESAQAAQDGGPGADRAARHHPVACPVTLAQTTLGPILPQFLARFPLVRVDMQVSNRVVDLVEEGLDVALRVRPRWTTAAAWSSSAWMWTRHAAGGQPRPCWHARARPRTLADLAALDTVSMSAPDGRRPGSCMGPDGAAARLSAPAALCGRRPAHAQVCRAAGHRHLRLPDYMCHDELRDRRLVQVLPDWAPRPGIFHAVFPFAPWACTCGAAVSGLSGRIHKYTGRG
jgi:DNA-binding transcriptional LysR family regulator